FPRTTGILPVSYILSRYAGRRQAESYAHNFQSLQPAGYFSERSIRPLARDTYLLPRAASIASTNAFAFAVIAPQSPFAMASLLTSAAPIPRHAAPALIHSATLFKSTPPVGTNRNSRSGAKISRKYPVPNRVEGKTFTRSPPAFHAVKISVGVNPAGTETFP